jgi:hypothetical protein
LSRDSRQKVSFQLIGEAFCLTTCCPSKAGELKEEI